MAASICPHPKPWHAVHAKLREFSEAHECLPKAPPIPLILNGWAFSTDVEKQGRWAETVRWAEENGCSHLIALEPEDFYVG